MTDTPAATALRSLTGQSAVAFAIQMTVIELNTAGSTCEMCSDLDHPTAVRLHYSIDEPHEGAERLSYDMCLTCVLPYIDRIPWLNTDMPIELEVHRGATVRPF